MKAIPALITAILLMASGLLPLLTNAQAPNGISYQAVIRNSSENLVINQKVGMRISIQKYKFGVPPSYQNIYIETHTPTTNDNGLVSLQIGKGTTVGGTFGDIDWGNGTYFIQTETDITGGTSYSITGRSQVLTVPYAFNAKTVENVQTDSTIDGKGNASEPLKIAQQAATKDQVLKWNGTIWKPGEVSTLGNGNLNIQKLNYCSFKTSNAMPLRLSAQDLGLTGDENIRKVIIISLEVGWQASTHAFVTPEQYRGMKECIYYEICYPESGFSGVKVYFPDKIEYWDQYGRIIYLLTE